MVTIILVIYKSDKKQLNNILKKIGKKYKVIIVDNSYDYDFSQFKITDNIKIFRSENNGNGAGINFALKKCNTKFAIYLDIDVQFKGNFIQKFINAALKLKKFNLLIPNHGNIKSKKEFIEKYNGEASIMLFNLKNFKSKSLFDENFFLYYEETDLLTRLKKKRFKSYAATKLKIKHFRAKSIIEDVEKIKNLRNWHYMWSMFYYYKKNFGYINALSKIINFLIKDFIMIFVFAFLLDVNKCKNRFYRIFGVVSSMLGFKSFLRP